MGRLLLITDSSKPSADSGYWLAVILLTVGISFALLLKQLNSGMTIFCNQPIETSLFPLQITEPVFSGKCGKIISHECEGLPVLCNGRPMDTNIEISQKFWLQLLNQFLQL
jgi:hypothetical protein